MDSKRNNPRMDTGAPRKTGASSTAKSPASKTAVSTAGFKPTRDIAPAERHELIAKIAFLKAERRGFQGGSPEQDWFDAEAEINAVITRLRGRRE